MTVPPVTTYPHGEFMPVPTKRTFFRLERFRDSYGCDYEAPVRVHEKDGNLVSSLLEDGHHAPVLDLDVPARLVQSSTPGHHHLFIDVPMSWRRYRRLLRALRRAGIVEYGWEIQSRYRGKSMVRKPGVRKVGR